MNPSQAQVEVKKSRFSNVIMNLEDLKKDSHELVVAAESIVGQLIGHQPPEPSSDKAAIPVDESIIQRMNNCITEIGQNIQHAKKTITKLDE